MKGIQKKHLSFCKTSFLFFLLPLLLTIFIPSSIFTSSFPQKESYSNRLLKEFPMIAPDTTSYSLTSSKTLESTFNKIFQDLSWPGGYPETRCGRGSMLQNTKSLRKSLEKLIKDEQIQSILDVACGDFNWMKTVDLTGIDYTGIDIVPTHIANNKKKYETENIKFYLLDGINEKLPQADLIICRDLLPHLSFENMQKLLKNFIESGSTYLLSTTFPETSRNAEIETGSWRPINLEKHPANLPPPLLLIKEDEEKKYMGLYLLDAKKL